MKPHQGRQLYHDKNLTLTQDYPSTNSLLIAAFDVGSGDMQLNFFKQINIKNKTAHICALHFGKKKVLMKSQKTVYWIIHEECQTTL